MFKLLIECSKDISEIHINFTDGTSVVKSPDEEPKPKPKPKQSKLTDNKPKQTGFDEAREELLDLNSEDSITEFDKVKKPEIVNPIRKAKVATELQNLDI